MNRYLHYKRGYVHTATGRKHGNLEGNGDNRTKEFYLGTFCIEF